MKRLGYILILFTLGHWSQFVFGASEPYLVEAKVQSDLENVLSRLAPREQYLVQVNAEVVIKSERRLVEGETLTSETDEPEPNMAPMPGFFPDPDLRNPKSPKQSRNIYRLVDVPSLNAVRVAITFDDSLLPVTVARGRTMVQSYLQVNYPGKAFLTFSTMPMLKPVKEKPEPTPIVLEKKEEKKPEVPKLSTQDKIWNYARWAILGLLVVVAGLLLRKPVGNFPAMGPQLALPFGGQFPLNDMFAPNPSGKKKMGMRSSGSRGPGPSAKAHSSFLPLARQVLLNKFIAKSEAFRLYYSRLNPEQQAEICSGLKGPGLDSLMAGLGCMPPLEVPGDITDIDDKIASHEKSFEAFVLAKEWQDKQFFGFLQNLTTEQVVGLTQNEDSKTVCVILRFLPPTQSAQVLDSLPQQKRMDVISLIPALNRMGVPELLDIEKRVRAAVQTLPNHLPGSQHDEIKFWGSVVSESNDQESLLNIMQNTQPEFYPAMAKYKFTLNDAASLPNTTIAKVLAEVDNEQLCLGLVSCPPDVIEVLIDALSPKRKDLIQNQMASYRGADPTSTKLARTALTKLFREALG